jgi:hypothetical protein
VTSGDRPVADPCMGYATSQNPVAPG